MSARVDASKRRSITALAAAAALTTLSPVGVQAARADVERDALGSVEAQVEYPADTSTGPASLTIARGGTTLHSATLRFEACGEIPCVPIGSFDFGGDNSSVLVRQLDNTTDPEVVINMYSRGAHCCFVAQIWAVDGPSAASAVERSFGNTPYELRDADRDGRTEFWTADDRFSYRFASFASSGHPVRVLEYNGAGAFRDVSSGHRAAIASDARRWWRLYRRQSDRGERLGLAAAWAADQYRLGRRAHALRILRRETRAGRMARSAWPFKRRFIGDLDGFLRRLGYANWLTVRQR